MVGVQIQSPYCLPIRKHHMALDEATLVASEAVLAPLLLCPIQIWGKY